MRTAIVYVMFEEYDFLEHEIELLNGQTCRDFTLVCVAGQTARPERLEPLLAKAAFPTVALIRREDNGPSGGFYDGQCWCLEQGFDLIVHVESDCFPIGSGLMEAIISEAFTHPVVIPICMPERLAMGWRFCAVRSEALRQAGLSYRCLYFITEDVYFVRTVSRAFPPRVLQHHNVYHAPVIAKHKSFDKFLSPFPYLMSRNHMLYNFRLIRQYRARTDIVNMLGYIVSLVLHGLHLAVRGKRRSAALLARGLWDGLLDREDVIVKERMEDSPYDDPVECVEAFPAQMVFDKETNVAPADAVRVFSTMGRRVLVKRVSMFFLFVAYYLSSSMALTDGETIWKVKRQAREGVIGRLAFWVVLPIVLLAAPLILLFGLVIRHGPAIELPRPSGLTPVEFPSRIR